MCLCCITLNAQECDSLFHSNDSTFCVNTSKTNNTSKKSLSKKKKSGRDKDIEYIKKYIDTNTKKQNNGKNIYNNKLPEYRIDGQNKGESNWAEFIRDVIIR